MRKRMPIVVAAVMLVALLLCGWTAYAAMSPNSAVSTSVTGTLKSVGTDTVTLSADNGDQTVTLAKSVWVYRNDQKAQLTDLKAGDQIELILNSKQQAAYVKAVSTEPAAVPEPAQAEPVQPVPAAPPAAVPVQTPPAAPDAAKKAPAPAIQQQVSAGQRAIESDRTVYPGLKDMDLHVEGKQFKLHIVQSGSDKGAKYDLSMKPEHGGTIHLKDEQAAQWIKSLLSSVDLKSPDAKQAIAKELAAHYRLDPAKLQVNMNARWEQDQASSKPGNKQPEKDKEKDKDKGKDKDDERKPSPKQHDSKKKDD